MRQEPLPRWLGLSALLLVAAVFGSNHVAARLAFDHGVTPITAVAVRSCGTAIVVIALLAALRVPLRASRATFTQTAVIGLVLAAQSYFLYSAVARLPVALALLAFNCHPILLSLLSWAAGAGRPPLRALVAMPVVLVGLALALDVAGSSANIATRWHEIGTGVLLALAAALCFSTTLFLTARWLPGVDARWRSGLTNASCGAAALAAAVSTSSFALPADGTGWAGLALLTLFYGTAITGLFALLPRMRSASDVAVLNFEPITALFLAWALLGQSVAPLQLAGALIVIGGIVAIGLGKPAGGLREGSPRPRQK